MFATRFIILVFAIVSLFSAVISEIISIQPCKNSANKCVIHQAQMSPCRSFEEGKPCKLKRGKPAYFSIDFTLNFNSPTLKSQPYWATLVDLPFVDMDTDACKTTQCPIVEGRRQLYNYSLPLSKAYPAGNYDIKWKFTTDNEENQCCVSLKMSLK